MQFNLNLNLGKANRSKVRVAPLLASAWQKSYKLVLLICLIVSFAAGFYIWRSNLSGTTWSEEKKQEFLRSQDAGVVFNQKNFEKVLAEVELRKSESSVDAQNPRDIFKPY